MWMELLTAMALAIFSTPFLLLILASEVLERRLADSVETKSD